MGGWGSLQSVALNLTRKVRNTVPVIGKVKQPMNNVLRRLRLLESEPHLCTRTLMDIFAASYWRVDHTLAGPTRKARAPCRKAHW